MKPKEEQNQQKMNNPNIKQVVGDRVLLKVDDPEEKTAGGIILHPDLQEIPTRGVIVALGQGTSTQERIIKVGDRVLFAKHSGTEIKLDEEKYLLIRETDIFIIL